MRRLLRSIGVAFFFGFLLMCRTTQASFHIVSDSVDFDSEKRTTTFDVRFSSAPDFYTLDHLGRQKNSFQYFFDRNLTGDLFAPSPDLTIIRAEEIHVANVLAHPRFIRRRSKPDLGRMGADPWNCALYAQW